MKCLLDTHAFLWLVFEPSRLSRRVASVCANPANELLVSVVSLWEIVIKHQIGRLDLEVPLSQVIQEQERSNRVLILPLYPAHVLQIQDFPLHHKDPFDRVLIAQALAESATLLTKDPIFSQYEVRIFW